MIKKEKYWKKNLLNKNFLIKDAIKILNINKNKIVLVIENNNKLLGTITNGDIRRNLIRGYAKNDSVIYALNKKPVTAKTSISKKDVLKLMIKNKINSIPILSVSKKIIGLYVLVYNKSNVNNDAVVVIMAGGKGKRLLPLTKKTPKPMLKIAGKPMAEKLLIKASNEGFKNFIISVNYLSHKIKNYFKDGKKWGVKISYLEEKKPLGTIGSLSLLENNFNKPILVINCDVITKLKLMDFIIFHKLHKQIATVGSIMHETKNQFGILKTKGSRLTEIVEKPLQKNYVNAGIYAFDRDILKYLKKNQKADVNSLFKKLIRINKKIIVYPLHEPWSDIGVLKELKKIKRRIP